MKKVKRASDRADHWANDPTLNQHLSRKHPPYITRLELQDYRSTANHPQALTPKWQARPKNNPMWAKFFKLLGWVMSLGGLIFVLGIKYEIVKDVDLITRPNLLLVGGLLLLATALFGVVKYIDSKVLSEFLDELLENLNCLYDPDAEKVSISDYSEILGLRSDSEGGLLTNVSKHHHIATRYKGLPISFCAIEIIRYSGRRRPTRVFSGLTAEIQLNNRIDGAFSIQQDAGILNGLKSFFRDHDAVKFDDPAFEHAFEVYASDADKVRAVLTAERRQKLTSLNNRLYDFRLKISGDHLAIAWAKTPRITKPIGSDASNDQLPVIFKQELDELFETLWQIAAVFEERARDHDTTGSATQQASPWERRA